MKPITTKKMLAVLVSGLMLMAGAVTAGAQEPWMYHDIVDADFVIAHMSVPMADNVMIIRDSNDNIKPDKAKSRQKIDGIIAAIMAVDLSTRTPERSEPGVYML
jgi:uncharacterized phosphosugar-binding protein